MFAIRRNLKNLQFWSPGGHNFELSEKMTEVLSYCFLMTFRMPLSACLRRSGAELDGGWIPPPPSRLCYNRSTGSRYFARQAHQARKDENFDSELTRDVISDLKVKSLHCPESSRPQSYRIAFEILEIGPVVWKISGGPFAPPPIRTCWQPDPIVARVKRQRFPFTILQNKSHWFQQCNLLPMPTNQPFTYTRQCQCAGHPTLAYVQYSTKVFGALEPPSRFLAISPKQMQISTPNFQHPLSHTFHILCKKIEIPGYDRSATNNVRVTSCSVDFNTATDAVVKLRPIGLYDMP